MEDEKFLRMAIEKARESVAKGGFPAGAVVVKDGQVVGEGISIGNLLNDPTSHGEMAAIRHACGHLKTTDLSDATLYASMEPCMMCLSAAMWGSVSKIVYACAKGKVSNEYYGGAYDLASINAQLTRPVERVHLAALEEESLALVREWEKKNL